MDRKLFAGLFAGLLGLSSLGALGALGFGFAASLAASFTFTRTTTVAGAFAFAFVSHASYYLCRSLDCLSLDHSLTRTHKPLLRLPIARTSVFPARIASAGS